MTSYTPTCAYIYIGPYIIELFLKIIFW